MSVARYFFSWSGRIGRLQWWLGGLVQGVIIVLAVLLFFGGAGAQNPALIILGLPLVVVALWFGIGLTVKRLHDHNKSGLWFFFYCIPIVGNIWQLVECGLLRGTEGDNDYGPDPRFRFDVSEDIEKLLAERDRERNRAMPQAPVGAAPMRLAPAVAARPVFGKRA